nr:MAG TPA: hypothetical protein [Caudoviricetes sp.]
MENIFFFDIKYFSFSIDLKKLYLGGFHVTVTKIIPLYW